MDWEIVFKLILACVMGALIGLERESLKRPAGFKTYTLVCIGSTLAMIVSIDMYYQYHHMVSTDPGRIAAQVISGIGFLGAGTIMREGPTVMGLTTAAGLWVVACIGLAIGAGLYIPAFSATVLSLFVLTYFKKFERRFTGMRAYKGVIAVLDDRPESIGMLTSILGEKAVHIKNISITNLESEHKVEVVLLLQLPLQTTIDAIIIELSSMQGLYSIERLN